jgi:predicted transcriptional regulator
MEPRVLQAGARIADALSEIKSRSERHQAYPVVRGGRLIGVVTARELLAAEPTNHVEHVIARSPITVTPSETARTAAERMAKQDVGRLVVVDDGDPTRAIGIVTRSDIVAAIARNGRQGVGPEGI